MTSNYYTYKTTEIYYETHGHGPEVIIFLHGFACSHLNWYLIKDFFDPEKYTLYLLDMKGFGESSKPHDKEYSIKDQAVIIKQFLLDKKLENFILVGHSLGAAVALTTQVLLEKALIKKLVLMGVPAYVDYIPRFIKILRTPIINRLYMLLIYLLPHAIKTALSRIYYDPGKITEEIISLYKPFYKKPSMAYTYIQIARRAIPDDYKTIISQYPSIDIPVMLIWSDHDKVISKRNAYWLMEDMPNCKLEFINNCGHNNMEECPVETYQLIRTFVEERG